VKLLITFLFLPGIQRMMEMESPRVGVVRESMLHRPLLIKVMLMDLTTNNELTL